MPKGTRRSVRQYAIQAQHDWAKAAGFHNREGHGSDAVFYGPNGKIVLIAEHKQRQRMGLSDLYEAMDQAFSYCLDDVSVHSQPRPVVGITTKSGPGKRARRYLVLRAEDWLDITERLAGWRSWRSPND